MREMENTAKAVEELMSQNSKLNEKISEQNTTYIRQVKDGLQSETTLRLMRQSIETLEDKLKFKENECEALKVEFTTWEAKVDTFKQINSQLEATLR